MQARSRWLVMAVLALSAFGLSKVVPAKMGTMKAYVTNSLGDDITMIDLGTLKPIGSIKVGKHVHGVCAQADGQKLFTTIESEKVLKVIDTTTNEVTATIPMPGVPNQCASTPDGHYVAVPNRSGDTVVIVDIPMGKVVKELPVKKPHNAYNTGTQQRPVHFLHGREPNQPHRPQENGLHGQDSGRRHSAALRRVQR